MIPLLHNLSHMNVSIPPVPGVLKLVPQPLLFCSTYPPYPVSPSPTNHDDSVTLLLQLRSDSATIPRRTSHHIESLESEFEEVVGVGFRIRLRIRVKRCSHLPITSLPPHITCKSVLHVRSSGPADTPRASRRYSRNRHAPVPSPRGR